MDQDFFSRVFAEFGVSVSQGGPATLVLSSGVAKLVTRSGVGVYLLILRPPGLFVGQGSQPVPKPLIFLQPAVAPAVLYWTLVDAVTVRVNAVDVAGAPVDVSFMAHMRTAQRFGGAP